MRKRPDVVALVLLVVLTAYAATQQVFVVPVMQNMLASAHVPVSLPARNFIAVSPFAMVGFFAFAIVTLLVARRVRPAEDRAQQAQVFNLASIVVSLFILGQAALYIDVAKSAGKVMRAGQISSAPALRQ